MWSIWRTWDHGRQNDGVHLQRMNRVTIVLEQEKTILAERMKAAKPEIQLNNYDS